MALQVGNINLPAGTLEIGNTEFMVRTMENFPILTILLTQSLVVQPSGTPIRLRDVAVVSDTYEEARTLSRIDGESSISLSVQKKKDGNTIS